MIDRFDSASESGSSCLTIPLLVSITCATRKEEWASLLLGLLHHTPICSKAANTAYVQDFLRKAEGLATYKGEKLDSKKKYQSFWKWQLHQSVDGRALKEAAVTPGSSAWMTDGTKLLPGRESINILKLRINAMPCLVRTKTRGGETCPSHAGQDTQKLRVWDTFYKNVFVPIIPESNDTTQ